MKELVLLGGAVALLVTGCGILSGAGKAQVQVHATEQKEGKSVQQVEFRASTSETGTIELHGICVGSCSKVLAEPKEALTGDSKAIPDANEQLEPAGEPEAAAISEKALPVEGPPDSLSANPVPETKKTPWQRYVKEPLGLK